MKVRLYQCASRRLADSGFTLVDAIFAMAVAGVMFVALYAGLAFGFRMVKMARENTRATQIMLEKMETVRLVKWSDLTNSTVFPTNKFVVPYYSVGGTNTSLMYTGQVTLTPCTVGNGIAGGTASYASDMKKITVRVDWCPMGATNRTRMMTSYVTRNGLQSYVW